MPVAEWIGLVVLAVATLAVAALDSIATATIALVGGVAMAAGFLVWMARWPRSYGTVFRLLAGPVGGPPGQRWPWRRRTRGAVLLVNGVLGLLASARVLDEPAQFTGDRLGAGVFAALSASAVVIGLRLVTPPAR